jgi:transposase
MSAGLPHAATAEGRDRQTTWGDHRAVLGGILWVARTGSSWREMPEEYGKWESAYRRHELWVTQGFGRVSSER